MAAAGSSMVPEMGGAAPSTAVPMVTATVSGAAMAAATPAMAPLDAARLQATLGGAVSKRTLDTLAHNGAELRAAMLLGSPDFMQR
jgi:hypothetical protein